MTDRQAPLSEVDAKIREDLRGYALALTHQAEKQVLRANVIVVEALGLFLGELQHLACALRKFVEPFCHLPSPKPGVPRVPA